LRPHITTTCPCGADRGGAPANRSATAVAIASIGPMPSPPLTMSTVGKSGHNPSWRRMATRCSWLTSGTLNLRLTGIPVTTTL